MKNILWLNGHNLSDTQITALQQLYGDINITHYKENISNINDIKELIDNADIIAQNLPINLQQQILKIATNKPVITATNKKRELNSEITHTATNAAENRIVKPFTEKQYEFVFKSWEQIDSIDVEIHAIQGNEIETHTIGEPKEKNVIWFSRHEMSKEQISALKDAYGSDINITQINQTIQNAYEIQEQLRKADIVCAVAPINIQEQMKNIIGSKPLLIAQMEKINDKLQFKNWNEVKNISIKKHELINAEDIQINNEKTDVKLKFIDGVEEHESEGILCPLTEKVNVILSKNIKEEEKNFVIQGAKELSQWLNPDNSINIDF